MLYKIRLVRTPSLLFMSRRLIVDNLAVSAQGFRRGANRVRKQMWYVPFSSMNLGTGLIDRWKDMRMRIIIGIGICVLLVVIIVPIVKA